MSGMIYIRTTTEGAFRSGEWGHLFSIQHDSEGRDLWVVEFPDGGMDVWPSWDALAGYDVRVQLEPIVSEETSDNQVYKAGRAAANAARVLHAKFARDAQD
jgi:hypothetical protein